METRLYGLVALAIPVLQDAYAQARLASSPKRLVLACDRASILYVHGDPNLRLRSLLGMGTHLLNFI